MTQVAMISQTLRASHCHAFLADAPGEVVILTSHPAAFAELELTDATRVVSVDPPPELLPAARLARNRLFRSTLARARSGSRAGAWLERAAKRVARRLRSLSETMPHRSHRHRPGGLSPRSSAMYAELTELHRSHPIERLVVFDVFDLPVALAFAEDHDLPVLVR